MEHKRGFFPKLLFANFTVIPFTHRNSMKNYKEGQEVEGRDGWHSHPRQPLGGGRGTPYLEEGHFCTLTYSFYSQSSLSCSQSAPRYFLVFNLKILSLSNVSKHLFWHFFLQNQHYTRNTMQGQRLMLHSET